MWAVAIEVDENFRNDFIHSLENLNRFAHLNSSVQTHIDVREMV